MNASLFHTPAAISVLTKEFLDDIGAENVGENHEGAVQGEESPLPVAEISHPDCRLLADRPATLQ
jgi:hypothetical protein